MKVIQETRLGNRLTRHLRGESRSKPFSERQFIAENVAVTVGMNLEFIYGSYFG
jgi:hypothetical protein